MEGEEREGGKGERRGKGGREEKGKEGGKGPSPPEKNPGAATAGFDVRYGSYSACAYF